MVCDVAVATNEYHTSSSAVLPHPFAWAEAVANSIVPLVVVTHSASGFTVKPMAPAQSSFAGALLVEEAQISKVPLLSLPYSHTLIHNVAPGV